MSGKKPWSITTTLRNPERLRSFLAVLQRLENAEWNVDSQKKYQVLLIQSRVYGYGNPQFYRELPQRWVDLVNDPSRDITFKQATDIFNAKNYEDPAMRGRQSVNAFKKFGFVVIERGKVRIAELGKLLLRENSDIGEIFFRIFLKWQLPNPGGRHYQDNKIYDIKPFIGALHLVNAVNQKEKVRGNKAKGISKSEFSLFVPTLTHYQNIPGHAEKIIALRDELVGKTKQEQDKVFETCERQFAREFLETSDDGEIDKLLRNLKDYGDNTIRYFRLTRYIHIRGGGFYIDLEPRRSIEINSLLAHDNAQSRPFKSREEYLAYITPLSEPRLPWETTEKYIEIIDRLVADIREYETGLGRKNIEIEQYEDMSPDVLKDYAAALRIYRRELQDEQSNRKSQDIETVRFCIDGLKNIFAGKGRSILLEQLSAQGLYALNDAFKIQPNYPVGDDNEPTFTAPANMPDIECFYKSFNAICEVTMLTGRSQWFNEGQPVMRHLRDFEEKHSDKRSYCLFIAPKLHRDTINTFWIAVKHEYEGRPQKIIPLLTNQFASVLEALAQMKSEKLFLKHSEIARLYDEILDAAMSLNDSGKWLESIPGAISKWRNSLLSPGKA